MVTDALVAEWLGRLGQLRPDRAQKSTRGIAPHKPLLLLAVLDMAEEGSLSERDLPLSAELAFRFGTYWKAVAERRQSKPEVRMPFYHLKTSACWEPLDAKGQPAAARHLAVTARLEPGFLECLNNADFRHKARRKLIALWFTEPSERIVLYSMLGIPVPTEDAQFADARIGEALEARQRGREARFRNIVVPAYDFTCALTGEWRLLSA